MYYKSFNSVYLGLGSNLGRRFTNIQTSVKLIEEKIGRVMRTSQIYDSPCTDEQNKIVGEEQHFLNSVVKVYTSLTPKEVLLQCKEIEKIFKRKPKVKYYEAREMDIDILLYNSEVIDEHVEGKSLHIPHMGLINRLFVLKPLLDIDRDLTIFNKTRNQEEKVITVIKRLLFEHFNIHLTDDEIIKGDKLAYLSKTLNISTGKEDRTFHLGSKTLLMAIINCSPDSFSKGEEDYDKIIDKLVLNKDKFDIVDIGGESTRPGADEVHHEVELQRVAPMIQRIRSHPHLEDSVISVDTRKSYVARKCLEMGANIINDVSGGKFDPEILKVVSEFNVPYVCMHSRTTPDKMMNRTFLHYSSNPVDEISQELLHTIMNIRNSHKICDWNIIIDPGIGFSKNLETNLEVIRKLSQFKWNFANPLLLGHSRKKFIQRILDVDVDHTLPGDIAITNSAIRSGCNIIRVHDIPGISSAIKMSDALFK